MCTSFKPVKSETDAHCHKLTATTRQLRTVAKAAAATAAATAEAEAVRWQCSYVWLANKWLASGREQLLRLRLASKRRTADVPTAEGEGGEGGGGDEEDSGGGGGCESSGRKPESLKGDACERWLAVAPNG